MISGWTLAGLVLALVGLAVGDGERDGDPPWWLRSVLWATAVVMFTVAVLT